jgi:hypothetical protein
MFGISTSTVAIIEVYVAVAQTLILLIAGAVAWRQLHEAQRARYLGAIIRVYDDIGSRTAYEDADAALGLPDRIEDYTPEERELATWTTRVYEQLAFLVESGMIPAKYIVPLDSRRIVWTWDALQPFIEEQRRLRDSSGSYNFSGDGRYFEQLVKRALAYRQRMFGETPRAHPPIPQEYRQRVIQMIARGERIGSGAPKR